jgi:hypothetical protein
MRVYTSEQLRDKGQPSDGFLHSDLLYVERTRNLNLAADMLSLPKLYYAKAVSSESFIAASGDELVALGDLAEGLGHHPNRHYIIWSREETRKACNRRFWSEELGWTNILWCDLFDTPIPRLHEIFGDYDTDDISVVEIPDIHIIRTILHGVVGTIPNMEADDAVDAFEPHHLAATLLVSTPSIQYSYGTRYARAMMTVHFGSCRPGIEFSWRLSSGDCS